VADKIRDAYLAGLKMLGRRELSEAQVRQRLARRGYEPDSVDAAVARLREERAIDDARVAEAIVRTQSSIRGRGRLRVLREVESAGIAAAIARRAVDDVFDSLDPDALLEASLAKRLDEREPIADDAEFRRLYRYLIGQGFEADRIIAALKARSVK
jgi:regulatory protein